MAARHAQNTQRGRHFAEPQSRAEFTHADDTGYYGVGRKPGYKKNGQLKTGGSGRRIILALVLILVVLAIAGGVSLFLVRGSVDSIKSKASHASSSVTQMAGAIKDADPEAVVSLASSVASDAHDIQKEMHTIPWGIASFVPILGQDVRSAQVISDVFVDLADNALVPIASNSEIMNLANVFADESVNIGALQSLIAAMEGSVPVLDRSADAVRDLPPAHLPQVAEIVDKTKDRIVMASDILGGATEALPVLPAMLGADGQTRNYVVLAQTNVEGRSAGGFPGAIGTITVTDGNISIGDFFAGSQFQRAAADNAVLSCATEEETYAFGSFLRSDALSVTYIPAFDRAAAIAASFWEGAYGQTPDGIIGVDPVFLQSMLALSGGFTTSDGTAVDGTNCARILLSDIYWRYDDQSVGSATDAFFVEVAHQAAHQFMGNLGSMKIEDLVDTISSSAKDHRLQLWFSREDEENIADKLGFSGKLPYDADKPVICTFSNDDTWSKIDWYLRLDTTLSAPHNNPDGTRTYDVTTVLTNTMTKDEALSAPKYVKGGNPYKRSEGDMITTMYFFAPYGGSIYDVSCDYNEKEEYNLSAADGGDDFMGEVYGYKFWSRCVRTYEEGTTTFTYKITVPAGTDAEPVIRTSPLPPH